MVWMEVRPDPTYWRAARSPALVAGPHWPSTPVDPSRSPKPAATMSRWTALTPSEGLGMPSPSLSPSKSAPSVMAPGGCANVPLVTSAYALSPGQDVEMKSLCRSEERRVGKECRSGWGAWHQGKDRERDCGVR